MSCDIRIARISDEPLDLAAHIHAVSGPAIGAVTTFLGQVRDHDPDAESGVIALEYSAHPDAEAALRAIAERAADGTDAIVAVTHRVGRLDIGDAAVAIAVGSAHRAQAFDVCRAAIEEIKKDLPVWKRQVEADGRAAWKGIG